LIQKVFDVKFDLDVYREGVNPELTQKIMPIVMDFSSLVFVLFIPLLAIAGWLTFNRKRYVFSEYIIVFLYTLPHWSIISFPISLSVIIFTPDDYLKLSTIMLPAMIAFSIYVMQRINRFKTGKFILRMCLFLVLAFLGYLGIVIVFYSILFATGTINLEDFKPVEQ